MSYIGKWVFHSVGEFGEEGIVYLNADEYLASPMPYVDENDEDAVADEMKERRRTVGMELRLLEDGKMYMLMPMPEGVSNEEIKAAVDAGEIIVYDGMLTQDPLAWEERDGELWFNSGIEGEVFDEKVDGWAKALDENGFFNFMNFRFKKA